MKNARSELLKVLQAGCGNTIEACAKEDTGRFNNSSADETFYDATQTYSIPVVSPRNAGVLEDVEQLAPKAGYLLAQAFPSLSLQQADTILTETEGTGGGFLDNGSTFMLPHDARADCRRQVIHPCALGIMRLAIGWKR